MHIPIIGNGDITTPQRAKECFDQYGVDAIMIGRASFGRPWIFKEVKHYIETGKELPALSFEWRLNVLRQEVLDSVNLLDERRGILHVRRHLAASPLFKGIPNFKETRIAMLRAETVKELFSILDYIRGVRNEFLMLQCANVPIAMRNTAQPIGTLIYCSINTLSIPFYANLFWERNQYL